LFAFRWIVAILSVASIATFTVLANRAAAAAEGGFLSPGAIGNLAWVLATYLSANLLLKIKR